MKMKADKADSTSRRDFWVPVAAGIVGLAVLLILGYIEPYPSPYLTKLQNTIMALSAAAFAAAIPGLLDVRMSRPGIAIRATSAIAVFLIVLFYDQIALMTQPVSAIAATTLELPAQSAVAAPK